ncbi:AAA family ATPase [Streptomyces sp. DW26H14]|uniref:AAA family ATPase n=1 Tax=Streptomyces sp. DW26H14 TaxID=3435395 RepID=UPI00403DE13E
MPLYGETPRADRHTAAATGSDSRRRADLVAETEAGGGTPAVRAEWEEPLVGREREEARVDRALGDPEGPCLVRVVGERGAGRTAFLRAAARRQRAAGAVVLSVDCAPEDREQPYLLALRLLRALERPRAETGGQRRAGDPLVEMMAAVEHGDRAAAADALAAALADAASTILFVDDMQYADDASVGLIAGLTTGLTTGKGAPSVRLVLSLLRAGAPASRPWAPDGGGASGPLKARATSAGTIELSPLEPADVAALLARRSGAAPGNALAELVHRLSRGLPGAVDVLLAEWARQGDMERVGEQALLDIAGVLPAVPRDNRFTRALHALGEPATAVASALSVLWPLGPAASVLTARVTGLPPDEIRLGLRELVAAGVVEELPVREDGEAGGWTFRIPLVEHLVRERLGPLERGRLAAAAVEALWAAGAGPGEGEAGSAPAVRVVDEAAADTYLPDRIVEAGPLVDADRAVAELVAAAGRMGRAPGQRRTLRWLRAADQLTGDTGVRDRLLLARVMRASVEADHGSVRGAVEELLRSAAGRGGLAEETLQACVSALVGAASGTGDLPELSRMTEARWWWPLVRTPAAVALGRAVALGCLGRWEKAGDVLARAEGMWSGAGPARVLPEVCRGVFELALGRPERFRRTLAMPETDGLSELSRYLVSLLQVQQLLGHGDLRGANDLLAARRLSVEDMPTHVRFPWHRLEGRWDEAMADLRWLTANGHPVAASLHLHVHAERATGILLARGRIGTARRLIDDIRQGLGRIAEPRHVLDRAEAEIARALGEPAEAVRLLRRGLETARAHGEVFATDELLAELAGLLVEAGDPEGAAECVRQLGEVAARTEDGRSRLLHLLASARLHGADDPDTARVSLADAVALARHRRQPFETATTLLAAARLDENPRGPLTEAYELFGRVDAPLWRFRVRAAMRGAGLTAPDREGALLENDRLLATLVSEGLSNRQAAAVLGLSPDAIANRLTRLFARNGVRSRTELVTAVLRGPDREVTGRAETTRTGRPTGAPPFPVASRGGMDKSVMG